MIFLRHRWNRQKSFHATCAQPSDEEHQEVEHVPSCGNRAGLSSPSPATTAGVQCYLPMKDEGGQRTSFCGGDREEHRNHQVLRVTAMLRASLLLVVFNVLPPLVMGLSGLYLRYQTRIAVSSLSSSSFFNYVGDLTAFLLGDALPQWLENALLLAVGHRLCRTILANASVLEKAKTRSPTGSPTADRVAVAVATFASFALLLFIVLCAVVFSMADYVAQDQMGASPDLDLVFNTLDAGPTGVFRQQAHSQPSYVGRVVGSIVVPYALGVALYTASQKLSFSQIRFLSPLSKKELAEGDRNAKVPTPGLLSLHPLAVGPPRCTLLAAIGMLFFLCSMGGYAPVTHISLCAFIGTPVRMARATHLKRVADRIPIVSRHQAMQHRPGAMMAPLPPLLLDEEGQATPAAPEGRRQALPNIVVIVVDSLSGHLMSTDKGRRNMPFYHANMPEAFGVNNTFQFRHARSTSGATNTALLGFLAGLLPFTDDGKLLVEHAVNPAEEFRRLGYETVLFDSLKSISGGNSLSHLKKCLEDGWDEVYSPESLDEPLVNLEAMDDRVLVAQFRQWLQKRSVQETRSAKPFFALHYWSNIHSPWTAVKDFSDLHSSTKYFRLMTVIDDQIRNVYDALSEARLLNNTMVIGGADHGDRPGHWRQLDPDSPFVLNIPLWMHIPSAVLPNETDRVTLRHHAEHHVVSNLDVMPTLRHILGMGAFTEDEMEHCLVGMDLLAPVPTSEVSVHVHSSNTRKTGAERVQMVWAGPPLENYGAAVIFIGKDRALSLHLTKGGGEKHPKNKEIEFFVDPTKKGVSTLTPMTATASGHLQPHHEA